MANSFKRFFRSEKLFDVLLIFLGITLSMQFDNWNDERKLRKKEVAILSDLYADVVSDSIRLAHVLQALEDYYIKPLTYLDSCLKSPKPIVFSQLKSPLQFKMGAAFMDDNKGAYECFKYDGVTLVQNNRLKVKLFDYYESQLSWISKTDGWREAFENKYILSLALNYGDDHFTLNESNYQKLRKDNISCSILSFWSEIYVTRWKEHQEMLPALIDLKHELEHELRKKGKDPKAILEESNVLPKPELDHETLQSSRRLN